MWFIAIPSYEPVISIITSLLAFTTIWFSDKRQMQRINQSQTIAEGGIGIQAVGGVNIGSPKITKKINNVK